jgi:hypothetical protein
MRIPDVIHLHARPYFFSTSHPKPNPPWIHTLVIIRPLYVFFHSSSFLDRSARMTSACCCTDSRTRFQNSWLTARARFCVVVWWGLRRKKISYVHAFTYEYNAAEIASMATLVKTSSKLALIIHSLCRGRSTIISHV